VETATPCCSHSPTRSRFRPDFSACYAALGMIESVADGELVRRIAQQSGARDAEAELCRRFAPRVRLYGLRHLRNEDRAADLVQGVLLAVLEAARAGRIEATEHVDRFILGTCRNVVQRVRDREARSTPADMAELERHAGGVEHSFEQVDVAALLSCLRKLDARGRTVVLLSFQAESGAEEIAKLMETSVGNVRVLRHRALASLRGCLDGPGGPP
jgi:RNA polymerase sigma-70 factor (ECF subfamily)